MIFYSEQDQFVGGLVGDALDSAGDSIKNGIINGFQAIAEKVFEYVVPFTFWSCKIGILTCVLIFICSRDKKAASVGTKLFFIYIIISALGSTI